ncbi:MAG: ribosomal protein S18-alanine N-acetyltransferase [Gammaproteobacteria bacterium]
MSAALEDEVMRIRPMAVEDVEAVHRIEQLAYDYPWSEGIFRDCLRVGYSCWVAENWSGLCGYGLVSVAVGECHILNLCVHPENQRHGVGTLMLSHLIDTARGHGAYRAFLEVRISNRGARRLYRGVGFDEIGRRKGYYPADEGREDAIVLEKDL